MEGESRERCIRVTGTASLFMYLLKTLRHCSREFKIVDLLQPQVMPERRQIGFREKQLGAEAT